MAKRRLLDSETSRRRRGITAVDHLTWCCLLVLTGLLSIHCASFSHLKNSYNPNDDTTNLDSLIGQWAPNPVSHSSYRALPSSEPSVARGGYPQQQPSLADDRQKFYSQLQLLASQNGDNYYYDNQNNDPIIRPASVFKTSDRDAFDRLGYEQQQQQYQLVGGDSGDYNPASGDFIYSPSLVSNHDDSGSIDRAKLLELLSVADERAPASLNQPQSSEDYRFLLEPNAKQHISIYQTADGEPISADDASISGLAPSSSNSPPTGTVAAAATLDDGTTEKRSSETKSNVTLTTLLEDEDKDATIKDDSDDKAKASETSNSDDDKTIKAATNATTAQDQSSVVTHSKQAEDNQSKPEVGNKLPGSGLTRSIGSMLTGFYHYLADKWPGSTNSQSTTQPAVTTPAKTTDDDGSSKITVTKETTGATTTTITRPAVSESSQADDSKENFGNSSSSSSSSNNIKHEDEEEERNKLLSTIEENNDKRTTATTSELEEQQTIETSDVVSESSERSIRINRPLGAAISQEQQPEEALFESSSTKREQSKEEGAHKISLLRQSSNLVMPFKSSDELVVESSPAADNKHQPIAAAKFIYAPEHHYHLSSTPSLRRLDDGGVDVDDAGQMFARLSQRSPVAATAHRNGAIRAGDTVYAGDSPFGAIGSLRPLYAAPLFGGGGDDDDDDDDGGRLNGPSSSRANRLGLMPNKSNDIYFLVMVAAFCAMAMTVVLAAGLFAYRVQQSRKSTSEADYPTYGVVGPNNNSMGGPGAKCGAASFVGGYFTGMGGPGSSSSGSKSGSVKQLADMYSIGADSGISSNNGAGGKLAGGKRVILANQEGQTGASGAGSNGNLNNAQARFANQNAARMFHYQHQKQQMIISDRSSNGRHTSASDLDSEDENDENSYTVYECPGLASAHEMEIKNPLFNDDQTP